MASFSSFLWFIVVSLSIVSAPTRPETAQINSVRACGNWSAGTIRVNTIPPVEDKTTDDAWMVGGGMVTSDASHSVAGLLTDGAGLDINTGLAVGNFELCDVESTFNGSAAAVFLSQCLIARSFRAAG